jgi:hypothetical protein
LTSLPGTIRPSSRLTLDVPAHIGVRERRTLDCLAARVGRDGHASAQLAVHLHDDLDGVLRERVGSYRAMRASMTSSA